MNNFYSLDIKEINSLTSDSVEIKFDIPSDIEEKFKFKAGQYITIRNNINGEEIRRSYSLCSDPNTNEIAVGVKRVDGGKMSTFLTKEIKIGDILEVMPPTGNFIFEQGQKFFFLTSKIFNFLRKSKLFCEMATVLLEFVF